MKKNLLFIFFSVVIFSNVHAQLKEADYRKQADEVRNYVWGWKIKAFDERNVPMEYTKYSKVILAKHEEITGLTKSKIKWIGFGVAAQRDLTYTHTTRELIKINDAAALEEYSQIDYQKFAQQHNDKLTTFLGVRVIKPDGTVKEINPDEIVLTDNTGKDKKAKLAVPDLEIGDMIDYFIQTVEFYDGGSLLDIENFVFADEDPVFHFSVHIEASDKLAIEYRSMNGAPDFKVSHDADNNTVMDAEQNKIAPFPVSLWMSPFRQIPILRFHMVMGYKGVFAGRINARKPGEIYKDLSPDEIVQDYDILLKPQITFTRQAASQVAGEISKYGKVYLDNNGGGSLKNNSPAVYYAARHYFLMRPDLTNVTVVDSRRNNISPDFPFFLCMLEGLFSYFGINSQIVLLPSKYGPRANEVMSKADYGLALLTDDGHIYTAETFYDSPDLIPYYLEGQQGVTLDYSMKMTGAKSEQGTYTAKNSSAIQNVQNEDLVISFDPAEPQKIIVDRKTTLSGLMKEDAQKKLLLYEDWYDEERKMMGIKNSFTDELHDSRKGKKIVDEYTNAFAEARKQWKDNFKQEITDQFDVIPDEVMESKVDQCGIFDLKPDFIYNSKFTVNAWIKKAGNNFILEAGKMIGPQLSLKPEQRDRKVDVYMPHARTLRYNLQIPVPAGYTAEGLDKLNTSIDNAQGSFVTTAKLDGALIKITITKTYKTSFVKVADWPALLSMLDAGTAFGDAKILLKKS